MNEQNSTNPILKTNTNKNTNTKLTKSKKISWETEELQLDELLLQGIYGYGFEYPSEIQMRAIPSILTKKDVIAQSQSGTGKTGAFVVSILQLLKKNTHETQSIILLPTRELAKQCYLVTKSLSNFMDIHVKLCIGGTRVSDDYEDIKEHFPHVVIGCTGRVYDLIKRKYIKSDCIRNIVIDEADELLSGSFKDQIFDIFHCLPQDVQVILFSATLPKNVIDASLKFMRDPIKLLKSSSELTLEGISQYKVHLRDNRDKYCTLVDLFENITMSQCIIYCNSVNRVETLYQKLIDDDYPAIYMHGNMKQEKRIQHFNDFKNGVFKVLISSDITARGIDVQQVSIVINFDVCKNTETYLHRIGRSGRWGRKGLTINFVTNSDKCNLRNIENTYEIKIKDLPDDFMKHI
jgi:superfamily II DNA/RNA helicase